MIKECHANSCDCKICLDSRVQFIFNKVQELSKGDEELKNKLVNYLMDRLDKDE